MLTGLATLAALTLLYRAAMAWAASWEDPQWPPVPEPDTSEEP